MFKQMVNLLRADGSIIINKTLAKNIGLNEAIIYGELVSKFKYWSDREQLTEDGYFYCTVEDMEDSTTLGEKPQKRAITNLINLGLIEYDSKRKAKGQDGKTMRHFKIVEDTNLILSLLSDKAEKRLETIDNTSNLPNGGCGTSQMAVAEPPKGRTNNTNINNTISNNTNNKKQQQHIEQEPKEEVVVVVDPEISNTYKEAFGEQPNNITRRAINRYTKLLDTDSVLFAIEETGVKGKKWDYAMGMLKKWISEQCKNFDDVVAYNEKYINNDI